MKSCLPKRPAAFAPEVSGFGNVRDASFLTGKNFLAIVSFSHNLGPDADLAQRQLLCRLLGVERTRYARSEAYRF